MSILFINILLNYLYNQIKKVLKMLKLKTIRQEQKITQKEIANNLNKSITTICDWERGRTEPSIEDLTKLSKIFNVSIDYLVNNSNEEGLIIMQNELSEDENYLIDLVRQLDMKDKSTIYELTELMVQAKKNKTK